MKIIVAVIVYNRLQNIERWLKCWEQCDTHDARLVIIHTGEDANACSRLIYTTDKEEEAGVKPYAIDYIHRKNIGFDIGTLQDVCKQRLKDFPNDWDYLLWCCDDTFPMQKDFVQQYVNAMQPGVGIACMKISSSVAPHVRTSGFMIPKEVSTRLRFPADPVTTKAQCYHFEHRGGKDTLTNQIRNMGLSCVQVAKDAVAPLWDSGYWKRLNRQQEHDETFGFVRKPSDKITVIATIYDSYPQIISSLILQTHKNWQLLLIHDGPASDSVRSAIDTTDERVKFIETPVRLQKYGHPIRQMALQTYDLADYTLITNSDNYYPPVALEYLLKGFAKSHTAVATYCTETVHSYKAWRVLPGRLERGFLDCGQVLIKSDVAKEIGWNNVDEHSADWIFFQEIANKYSWKNFIPVAGCLMTHN